MNRPHNDDAPPAGSSEAGRRELLAPATQIVTDREAYLGQGRNDVGRRISDEQVELFVIGDVAGSLQREFLQHASEFIALHDLGIGASVRLLTSLAGAAGARVQRLSVRRQGHGVALAVLQFVEMPLSDATMVRVYSTDLNADGQTRTQVARVLLGHSRLGVLLMGDLQPHVLTAQLTPLQEAIRSGAWPNRELLMVPLGSATALAAQAALLAGRSDVEVHVTPHADKPRQVWSYIGGAWNRRHGTRSGEHTLPLDLAIAVPRPVVPSTEAPTEAMPLDSLPTLGRRPSAGAPSAAPQTVPPAAPPVAMPRPGGVTWQGYAERCAQIKGSIACCVFDTHTGETLAQAGGPPNGERLAQQGTVLLAQIHETSRALGLGPARAEATVSTASHHLLLRPVPGHPGIAVHLVVSASNGNLTLARLQLERVDPPQ